MIINKVNIIAFGGLKNKYIDLENGINVIFGENEAGKSTIQSFIKIWLYGFSSCRGKDYKSNERLKYTPLNGEKINGELHITFEGKRYIIKRIFGKTKKEDECNIFDAVSGDEIYDINKDEPGKSIFGVNRATFINTLFIGLFIISNDMIIRNSNIKYKEDAEIIFLILASTFIPLFIYSDYVYGEVMSIGTISLCCWMISSYLNNEKLYKLFMVAFCGFFACYVRLNSIIFVIAAFLILLFSLITNFDRKKLFLIISVVVAAILLLIIPKVIYGSHIPNDSYSMPPTLHISMGMQDEAGWFNSYNTNTYQAVGFDPVVANNWAKENIKNRLNYFIKNPDIGISFYYNKIILQWNSPMMQSLWMNHKFNGTPGRLATSFYDGKINSILNVVSSCHQMFVYLMCVVFSINIFKDRENIKMEELIFVVFVIGGFFFSILWEAKTRYILPYYSVLLIEAAFGFSYLKNKLFANRHLFN